MNNLNNQDDNIFCAVCGKKLLITDEAYENAKNPKEILCVNHCYFNEELNAYVKIKMKNEFNIKKTFIVSPYQITENDKRILSSDKLNFTILFKNNNYMLKCDKSFYLKFKKIGLSEEFLNIYSLAVQNECDFLEFDYDNIIYNELKCFK